MSSSPQMRRFKLCLSFQGPNRHLIQQYEQRFGRLPDWLLELDRERIASLVACCIRIGMRLPADDLLQEDEV